MSFVGRIFRRFNFATDKLSPPLHRYRDAPAMRV